jgi:hypothetical protein
LGSSCRVTASPRLPRVADRDAEGGGDRDLRALGLAKATGAGFFLASTSETFGDPQDLVTPKIHPPTRELLGQRQPGWTGRRISTGRSDSPRRRPWPITESAGSRSYPRLQHLRASDAESRRSSRADVHTAGAEGRAADGAQRWHSDPFTLLCERPYRRHPATYPVRSRGTREHRNPRRSPSRGVHA